MAKKKKQILTIYEKQKIKSNLKHMGKLAVLSGLLFGPSIGVSVMAGGAVGTAIGVGITKLKKKKR